jgi:small-conductance mechanosensitive channel
MAQLTQNMSQLSEENRRTTSQVQKSSLQLDLLSKQVQLTERHVQQTSQRVDELVEEMQKFRAEMQEMAKNSDKNAKEFRRQMAEISRKMGTMAEDLVAPSIPRILAEIVNCPELPQMEGVRILKRLPDGRVKEYDTIAVCGDYILINETKSRLRSEDIADFVKSLEEVRDFLPEYADKQVIGTLASFYIDPNLVTHGERQGLIMLGVVDGLMEILNRRNFVPKRF